MTLIRWINRLAWALLALTAAEVGVRAEPADDAAAVLARCTERMEIVSTRLEAIRRAVPPGPPKVLPPKVAECLEPAPGSWRQSYRSLVRRVLLTDAAPRDCERVDVGLSVAGDLVISGTALTDGKLLSRIAGRARRFLPEVTIDDAAVRRIEDCRTPIDDEEPSLSLLRDDSGAVLMLRKGVLTRKQIDALPTDTDCARFGGRYEKSDVYRHVVEAGLDARNFWVRIQNSQVVVFCRRSTTGKWRRHIHNTDDERVPLIAVGE